jgi:hypothetical protein
VLVSRGFPVQNRFAREASPRRENIAATVASSPSLSGLIVMPST